ncbi:TPA: HdeD family acid-resistance protein [Elizabethkingia anophelis]
MMSEYSNPVFLVAMKNWKILLVTGMLSIASGLYIFFIPFEIYPGLSILLIFTFIMACMSGIVFSLQDGSVDIWTSYLVYAGLFFALEIFMITYYNIDLMLFVFGCLSLFRSVQFFFTILELRKYNTIQRSTVTLICIPGVLFSIVLILNPVISAAFLPENIMIGISFIMIGALSLFLVLVLRKLNRFHNNLENLVKDLREKDILYK